MRAASVAPGLLRGQRMTMLERSALWGVPFLLLACGDDQGKCDSARGNLLTPPKPGAVVMDYAGPGLSLVTRPAGESPLPMLLVDAESVRTSGGHACSVQRGFYGCGGDANFKKMVVQLGELRWSATNRCRWYEDSQDILLEAPNCIAQGTIVVEGELLELDPTLPPPKVILAGPRQHLAESSGASGEEDHSYNAAIPCTVEGGHYACPTLGYLNTATHSVIVAGIASEVELPVANCRVETVQLDILITR